VLSGLALWLGLKGEFLYRTEPLLGFAAGRVYFDL
jgi:hypothetical protein